MIRALVLGCAIEGACVAAATPVPSGNLPEPPLPAAPSAPVATTAPPGGGPPVDCAATTLGDFARKNRPPVGARYLPRPFDALVFEAGLAIDADGGRHAYRVDDKGLDTIRNACPADPKKPCYGVVERAPGDRVRQPPPNDAYYVSPTALVEPSKAATDPDRYVDSETIAYLVLPVKTLNQMAAAKGVAPFPLRLGDLAIVRNGKNGKTAFAILADIGPAGKIGEGSIALAETLGIPSSPRRGGAADGVQVAVFLGSGNRRPKPQADIDREGRAAFERWGGPARLDACFARAPR